MPRPSICRQACRPPSPVRFDLSPMRRASAFAPSALPDRPPAAGKKGQPAAERPDRAVDGNAPFHRNLIVPPATADRRDFGKASRHNIESFPYEPDGKSIRCPENRCALHANAPPKTERERTGHPSPVERRPSAASSPAQPPSGIHIYRTAFGQAGTKNLRRRTKPAQEHAPYPPTDGTPVSRNSVQRSRNMQAPKSKKGSRTKNLRIPTYRTSLPQTDIRILPQPFFSRKKGISYTSALLSAMLRPHTEREGEAGSPPHRCPPLSATLLRPFSPAFACSPALSPEKRNDAGSEVGNDAPHGRKTSVTLLPAPHSPSTFFPQSVPGFPVLTAALARMPTRQVYTPMDRGLCLPSSSPTAGSPGSKPCKHPDRRPLPRRGIETVISESAARRVFRRHVRTCRRNRPRPGPKPSPGNGPPRKMRK